MPVKGKGALFTELSTGNGDNVVPVPLQNSGAKFRGNIASGTVTVRQEPVLRQGVDSEKGAEAVAVAADWRFSHVVRVMAGDFARCRRVVRFGSRFRSGHRARVWHISPLSL